MFLDNNVRGATTATSDVTVMWSLLYIGTLFKKIYIYFVFESH